MKDILDFLSYLGGLIIGGCLVIGVALFVVLMVMEIFAGKD